MTSQPISFYYMELLKHNCVGSYMMKDGQIVFEYGGMSCAVFQSMCKRHYALVKFDYGKYSVAEL